MKKYYLFNGLILILILLLSACSSTSNVAKEIEIIEKEKIVIQKELTKCYFDDEVFSIDKKLLIADKDELSKDFYIRLSKIILDLKTKLKLVKESNCIQIKDKIK